MSNTRENSCNVLLTTAYFEPGNRAGGPVRSISRIIDTAGSHITIKTLTRDRDLGSPTPYSGLSGKWVSRGSTKVFYLNTSSVRQWFKLIKQIQRQRFTFIYCNSLWEPHFSVLPILAARLGLIPVRRILLAPRGELSPGALGLKRRKKRSFLAVWKPLLRSDAVLWHASTDLEAADIRRVWPKAMIEVVEDQIDLPLEPAIPESMPEAPLKAVFISRISPMKNLHTTLRALSLCTDPITFSIYGPIEDEAYWNKCLEIIQGIPINIDVCYRGVLPAGAVRETFTKYDLFIFPTLGENFGHVIAESLSASCAVICSDKTPWSDVLSGGGGIALSSPSADLLSKEIQRFSRMTADERRDLRIRVGDSYRRWRHHTNDVNILERAVRRLNSKGFSS